MATKRGTASQKRSTRPSSDGILEAAERVFARQGYGETSLRQLIAEAGVSTTAFYARFTSKEAVLEAVLDRFFGRLQKATAELIAEATDLEDAFDRGVDLLVGWLAPHRPLVRLTLTEAAASPVVLPTLRAAYDAMASMMRARFERLIEKGVIEATDADALAWAMVGALRIQVVRWAVFESLDDRALVDALRATAQTVLPALVRERKALRRSKKKEKKDAQRASF